MGLGPQSGFHQMLCYGALKTPATEWITEKLHSRSEVSHNRKSVFSSGILAYYQLGLKRWDAEKGEPIDDLEPHVARRLRTRASIKLKNGTPFLIIPKYRATRSTTDHEINSGISATYPYQRNFTKIDNLSV